MAMAPFTLEKAITEATGYLGGVSNTYGHGPASHAARESDTPPAGPALEKWFPNDARLAQTRLSAALGNENHGTCSSIRVR